MKILFFLSLGVLLTNIYAYDLETWKKNPPALAPAPFLEIPSELSIPNGTEPFTPPFLPPARNDKFFYDPIFSILPQVLPSDLPSPDAFLEKNEGPKKKEFLISYKLYVKDGVAQGERYGISEPIKTRVGSGKYIFDYQCRIDVFEGDILGDDQADYALKIILEHQKEAVLECLYKSGVQVRDDTFGNNFALSAKTTLTLPAKTVQAYLDNSFLILEVWKERK
ncbi:hypothetical protein BKH41_03965 [Helicobacter sp. 12S02232-10]|nr:hypothetical protein BKH41_03965 [Helicobacter sp. 12S02232-10]